MKRQLLYVIFILFSSVSLLAQAPAWAWAKHATSSSPETAWDVAYDSNSGDIYTGGYFSGNLSAAYGTSLSASYGSTDGFLARYDQTGTVVWALKMGGTGNDEVHSVACDGSGNVYVTGIFTGTADFDPTAATFTLASAGQSDGFLAKYSSTGTLVWATKFGGSNDENSWKMSADANGVYLTGNYESSPATFYSYSSATTKTTSIASGQLNAFGAKYNSSGVVQWVWSGGGSKDDMGFSVTADANNVFFIGRYDDDLVFKDASGATSPTLQAQQNNKPQVYILSVSQAGAFAWQNNITSSTGGDMVIGWSIAQDANDLYVTGYFDGNINFKYPTPSLTQSLTAGGNVDLFLAKLGKSAGTFSWNTSVTGNGIGEQIGRALEVDMSGNVILGGVYTNGINYSSASGPNHSSAGGHDIFVTSYSNTGTFLWSAKAGGNLRDYLNGLAVDGQGNIFTCGEQDGGMVVGTTTLQTGGGNNVWLGKLGCAVIANNTITATQTVCAGSAPATFTGSLPTGGSIYSWQSSANNVTWTAAAGTSTAQNYSATSLTATTYFRRVVSGAGTCSASTLNSNTITVFVNTPPSTALAGTSQSVCSSAATMAATSPTAGTGLWSLLGGSGTLASASSFSSAVTGLGVGTNSFVWTVSSGVCPTSTAMVTILRYVAPVSNAGASQTLCSSAATLGAANPTIGTGLWSVITGTASLTTASSPSSALTALSAGINQFVWTVSNGNCTAATSTVTVYRDLPPTSNAGTTQVICASSATLAATMPTIGTGMWSLISGSATITAAAGYSSTIGSIGTGTNQFLWTVSNGSCPTATSLVSVIRNVQPTSNAGTNQTICATAYTLAATNPTVGTGLWSVISGTASVSSAVSYSSPVTGLSAGLNQFVWTVANGPCTAATSTVTLIRNLPPTANAGTNQAVCSSSLNLAAVSPTIGTGIWTQISGSGTLVAVSNPSTQVNGIGYGATQFVWTVANQGCTSATSTVTIIRDIPPSANAGTAQSVCASSINLSATVPTVGVGSWSVISGSASVAASGSYSSLVTSLSAGPNQFIWTVTGGACPNATSAVTITRDIPPTANAGPNQSLCATSATLAAASPTLGTGFWSIVSGSATLITASNYSSGVTGLSGGVNQFLWTVTNGSCPSATSALSIMRDLPPAANAGADQTICVSTYSLAATHPTLGAGMWTVLSGTASLSASASYSSSVTGLSPGQNQFLWTVTNGSCPSATSAVNIFRNTPPTANAGTNQAVCSPTVNLSALTPTVGNGAWSILSGNSSLTAITNPSSQVSGLSFGANQFLWTVSNLACASATATVTITRDTPPTANAGSSNTICASAYTLAASIPAVGVGSWSVVTGSASLTSASSPSSQVTSLTTGMNQFLWTVTGGACPSATSMVTIGRDALPTANAGLDNTVCISSSTLLAQTPTVGTGAWALVSGSGSLNAPASYSCPVTGLSIGSNIFEWTVTNGVCPAATASVNVFYLTAINADAGADQVLCSPETTLSAVLPANATGIWSVAQGTAIITTPTSPTASLSSLATGTTILVWTVTNGSCPTASDSLYLNRDELPQASAGSNQSVCGNSATLAAIAPTLGVGIWTLVSGNAIIASPLSSNSQVTSLDAGENKFIWTVTNGVCPAATATVTIIQDAPSGQISAGSNFTVCASAATLSASYSAPGTASWTLYSGNALFTASTSPATGVSNLNTGLNTFIYTNVNGSCPAESDTVTVFVTLPLAAASAGNNLEVCATECTLSATNASGLWTVLSGNGILTAPSNPATAVTALSIGTNIFIWTVSQEFCPSTSDTLIVVRNENLGTVSAGPDQVLCGSSGNLAALPVTSGQGYWTSTQNSNLITNAQQAQTTVEQLSPGINTFVWTVTNANCPALSDTVLLTSDAIPSVAFAGKDLLVCQDHMALDATTPAVGSGKWTLLSGTGTFADAKIAGTTISGLTEGLQVLVWTVGNGVCPQTSDTVKITRTFTPINPDAGADQVIETSTVQLTATIPQEGLGTWSVVAGSAVFSDVHDKDALVSSLPFGNTVLKWTIANKSCPDVSDDMVIRVKELNIPNAFSPNGDGINDKFVVTSLAYYKEVKLSIFNTWGTLLYHNPDYQNDWSGTGFANERLADDTYYYIIEIPGLKNVAGFVIIKQTQ